MKQLCCRGCNTKENHPSFIDAIKAGWELVRKNHGKYRHGHTLHFCPKCVRIGLHEE